MANQSLPKSSRYVNVPEGSQFFDLTVIRLLDQRSTRKECLYECLCVCGQRITVRSYDLRRGHTKSCGCLQTRTHRKDITGQRFGRLVAVRIAQSGSSSGLFWACQCDCGNVSSVRGSSLRSGHTQSCGCAARENLESFKSLHTKHGENANGQSSVEMRIFEGAKARCENPHRAEYKNYGERGIEFRFKSILELLDDIGRRPSRHHSLDRIDTNGHYEKGNVRWATAIEQGNNRRNNRLITFQGATHTVAEWGRIANVSPTSIRNRLRTNKPLDDLLGANVGMAGQCYA